MTNKNITRIHLRNQLIQEVKKQIQKDIFAYLQPFDSAGIIERRRSEAQQIALSQIVIDNFENLEK